MIKDLSKEEVLTRRLIKRDESALHMVYVNMYHPLLRYAYRYVTDWDEAQDIVQTAFIQLWINAKKLDPERNVNAYLAGIVHNLCSDYLRHLNIIDSNQDKLTEALIFQNMFNDSDDVDTELKLRLEVALQRLPERSHDILIRHIVDGKKCSEIAEEYGVAESTVKTHLKRALKALRQQLIILFFTI